jgi:hypothetical protein
MARQVRIQFEGAVYHVMARGDQPAGKRHPGYPGVRGGHHEPVAEKQDGHRKGRTGRRHVAAWLRHTNFDSSAFFESNPCTLSSSDGQHFHDVGFCLTIAQGEGLNLFLGDGC